MRIHGLTVDRGGCRFYRIAQPFAALSTLGHETSYDTGIDAETFESADIIVTQFMNEPRNVETWEALARRGSHALVYEVDDDLFTIAPLTAENSVYRRPETPSRIQRAMAAADLITVTTPYLAELYAPYNSNVVVLPNCVPDWMPDHKPPEIKRKDRVIIGYPCSPSHMEDWQWFAPTLLRFMGHHPQVSTRFWGPKDVLDIAKWRRECFSWIADVEEYLRSLSMHIGIAPLCDMAFNKGKSGIKALEYAAIGVPSICSDWPQYREVVRDRETGLLVRSLAQWSAALRALVLDVDMRAELGTAAREHARSWTIGRHVHKWEQAYKSIL